MGLSGNGPCDAADACVHAAAACCFHPQPHSNAHSFKHHNYRRMFNPHLAGAAHPPTPNTHARPPRPSLPLSQ